MHPRPLCRPPVLATQPATGTWTSTNLMVTARYEHTATLLSNGKVLVAGGYNGNYLASAELYDPATNTWSTTTNPMGTARYAPTATLLDSGKVLVAGGLNVGSLASAELYDPVAGTWSSTTNPMGTGRYDHTATLLPNGKVLVAGGYSSSSSSSFLASAELYDPATGTWSSTGPMGTARFYHTDTLLPSGKVLVAGGANSYFLASAELYDPVAGTWSSTTNPMGTARYDHTATLLDGGKVLVAGGYNGSIVASVRLYGPGPGVTAISPPNGPTLGGTTVTLTGTHFTGATSATVCGAELSNLAVVNDTTLTGTTPAHAATTTACDVVVTTAFGPGTGTALFSYAKSAQTLTFGTPPALVVGGPAGTVSATSSGASLNGLTTFSSLTPTICIVTGASVSAVAAGTCTVAADNPGDGDFDAAPQVTLPITVAPAPLAQRHGHPTRWQRHHGQLHRWQRHLRLREHPVPQRSGGG